MKQIDIIGTPLCVTTYREFIDHCQKLARSGQTYAVDLTNTQIATMRRHEPGFRTVTSCFDYFVPDGTPLIWSLNAKGAQLRDRVYGPKFMLQMVLASPPPNKHYLLGGSCECLLRLKTRLEREGPNVQIVGARDGYSGDADDVGTIDEINRLSPDFVWIGLGTPKQQEWVHRHKFEIRRGVLFAVGFAFDVIAGTKKDAPEWMQRSGLTWVYRVLSEPRRLFGRYLKYNSLFLFYLLLDAARHRRNA